MVSNWLWYCGGVKLKRPKDIQKKSRLHQIEPVSSLCEIPMSIKYNM